MSEIIKINEEQKYPKDLNLQIYADFVKSIKMAKCTTENIKNSMSLFKKIISENETLQRITRIIYNLSYTTNLTINSGTRRPKNLRESGREKTMGEDEYIYDIFKLLEKMHSGDVNEIDRYLILKRYMSANYNNLMYFYEIIKKKPYSYIKIDFVKECIDGVERLNFRNSHALTNEIINSIDFSNYYMIENPRKHNGSGKRMFLMFNSYGELSLINENNRFCYSCWGVINDVAYSFKENRIKNMIIEGTIFIPDADGNEDENIKYASILNDDTHSIKGPICFSMYDMYTLDEFLSGKCNKPYIERYNQLKEKINEAVSPTDKFRVANISKISSNESLLEKLCSEYTCDGYIIMSPNKMDYTKLQEFTISKQTKRVHINDAYIKGGEIFVKIKGFNGEYNTICLGRHISVKTFLMRNLEYLINKDVDIVFFKKNNKDNTLDMPMLCSSQK
jgi:hypothetical protein